MGEPLPGVTRLMATIDQPNPTPRRLSGVDALILFLVGATPLALSSFNLLPDDARWEHHPFHAVVEGLGSFAALIVAVAMIMLRRQGDLTPAYVCTDSDAVATSCPLERHPRG